MVNYFIPFKIYRFSYLPTTCLLAVKMVKFETSCKKIANCRKVLRTKSTGRERKVDGFISFFKVVN